MLVYLVEMASRPQVILPGWYLPEAAHPYYTLAPQFEIDFAAPAGLNPPLDPGSAAMFTEDESVTILKDEKVKGLLANTKRLKDVNADDYIAIFYIGAHGPVIDLSVDKDSIKLDSKFYRSDKIVSAFCHGIAALVSVTGEDGKSIFNGKNVTAFAIAEEQQVGKVEMGVPSPHDPIHGPSNASLFPAKAVPFQNEERMQELGGTYVKVSEAWAESPLPLCDTVRALKFHADDNLQPKISVSGTLLTGQNPGSAKPLADELLKVLQKL
ncbi:hypothetical protein EWM64_g1666 [Hericium alpestre]|uniref:D-lactate dehydratase n=1 Tax=Hericium alpestre TaxID=135208 RepID=A0A4Z0A6I5_9AGAM|nr:hypothetical protein EWM64_g1666 [Hericium alpestre]